MSKTIARISVRLAAAVFLCCTLVSGVFAQNTPFFAAGNLVVSVEGNGVQGATGSYEDNQAAPFTLFQFQLNPSNPTTAPATYVDSLVFPQTGSGANFPVSGEYGSSSEGTLQPAGSDQYLAIMGYGVNAAAFNSDPNAYSAAPNTALGQSGSLTGQGYTPVPRVVTLIDPYGNVNSSTALYNIFDGNNPRSTYTADGTHIYVSGQGTSGDATGGVFYTTLGSSSATTITGTDAGSGASQDTRTVQIYNNTLYVSMDSKSGSYNRSYIGTLGDPPATSVFTCTGVGAGCPTGDGTIGPALMSGFGNTGGTGKVTITSGSNSNGNSLNNTGLAINLSPENYFFASPSVLYVADSGSPKNSSNADTVCTNGGGTGSVGNGGLQKWINSQSNGTGTWSLAYTLYKGLNLVLNTACDPSDTDGTTGLIGLTGVVVSGNVELFATNYTIADLDPTYVYGIADTLSYTTASQASSETFTQIAAAPADSNFKGVAFAPTLPAGSATITTVPSGLTVTSAGTGCAPGSFYAPVTPIWTPGSTCTLSVVSPQPGGTGTQYEFSQWQDGTTGTSDTVTAPATSAVYTATFNTQYLLTTSATTGGTVSAGGYYTSGTDATITATPASGYYFVNFTGATTSTSNPLTLLISAPQSITANFAAQQSQTISFTTNPPASAAYGSSFTVAASASSGLAVTFTSSGSCTNSGATYTVTSSTGSCSVIANQSGNGAYGPAPTVTDTVSATAATTTIAVTSVSPSSEDYGADSPVTITAVLSWTGSGAAPTGAITIGGNGPSGYSATSCAASNGGSITCTATYTPTTTDVAGSYTESATFAGDANYSTSTSTQTNNFAINSATSTTSVSSSASPSVYGTSVTFTATVSGENGAVKGRTGKNGVKKLIAGSVTWSPNTGCSASTLSGYPGVATCTTTTLPVGSDSVVATYAGDGNHGGSSGSFSQTVNAASTTLAVTSVNPSNEDYGADSPVTITAVLSWTGSGSAPTGAVTIGGNGPSGYGATSCGAASGDSITCTASYTPTTADAAGSYTESANFAGDGNYSTSSSTQANNFVINQASAATVVTSSLNPSTFGQSVTFTATISGENGAVKGRTRRNGVRSQDVGGSVTWSSNTGCGTTQVTSGSPGTASCTTSILPAGSATVTATYSGDSNHGGSVGTFNQTVKQASQSITVTTPAPSTEVYNGSFTVVASASSGLPLTYTATGVCTNGGTSTYTITAGSGNCTVKIAQAGNTNYTAAATVTETTTASLATQTVSFGGAPTTAAFGTSFTVTATSNAPITPTIGGNSACSVNGDTVTIAAGSGTCTLTATWSGNGNYKLATATQSTTAEKATPTITWATPAAIPYGTALSPTQLDASSTVGGTFKYTPASGKILVAGNQILSATLTPTSKTDYNTATATVTLDVLQAATTTTVTSPDANITLSKSGSASTIVDFTVTSYKPTGSVTVTAGPASCTGTVGPATGKGSCKLTLRATGTYTITASYPGDANHTASNNDSQSPAVTVTVNP